jgi:hypothetical protein
MRLIKNLDVIAGLLNSAVGKVIEVLYAVADVKHLRGGKQPPLYAIVVDFPDFRGFLQGDNRIFPFPNEPNWDPVTRQKLTIASRDILSSVRASQTPKDCYHIQFPLDVATHITAHWA